MPVSPLPEKNKIRHFPDSNGLNRRGYVSFENKDYLLGKHDGAGIWAVFDVQRKNTADGKLILQARPTAGPNVMIARIALVLD